MQPIFFQDLVLREFRDGDAEAFTEAARESVNTVGRWMSWCHVAFSVQDALDWFQQCRSDSASESAYEFGVFSRESGAFLGGAGLNSINRQHLFCNLGYWVRESAQRNGVAFRTVQALAPHAFQALKMQRVEIVIASGNTASEAVARKCGAQLECLARNRLQLHGTAVPALVFSIIP